VGQTAALLAGLAAPPSPSIAPLEARGHRPGVRHDHPAAATARAMIIDAGLTGRSTALGWQPDPAQRRGQRLPAGDGPGACPGDLGNRTREPSLCVSVHTAQQYRTTSWARADVPSLYCPATPGNLLREILALLRAAAKRECRLARQGPTRRPVLVAAPRTKAAAPAAARDGVSAPLQAHGSRWLWRLQRLS
jgi:hypothetical protein